MVSDTTKSRDSVEINQFKNEVKQIGTGELKEIQNTVTNELERRDNEIDIDNRESVTLINSRWVKWRDLSAHPNLKAVKPWIMRVTGTHEKYGVDGEWLDKQKIDGKFHMDVSELERGDIIKVSGASHNNRKHRYYRVLTITDDQLYHASKYGLDESEVIEEVG